MGKSRKQSDTFKFPEQEKLFGRPVIKSGSCRHTAPDPKDKNEMEIDYKNLEYKTKKPQVKVGIGHQEGRFPPGAEMPEKKKYDEKGNYIKQKAVATEKKGKSEKRINISMTTVMREGSLSNPRRKFSGKK